jgi:hypothetical protein
MHWYDQVFLAAAGCFALGLPVFVLWGWAWWSMCGEKHKDWRWTISKVGVVYSTVIMGMAVAFVTMAPKNSITGAEFPYTYHWAPLIFRFSAAGLLLAVFGRGKLRTTNMLSALAGCSFSMLAFALL